MRSRMIALGGALTVCALLASAWGVKPVVAAQDELTEPPALRITAGERSVEVLPGSWCLSSGLCKHGPDHAPPPAGEAGPFFPSPALAVWPGDEVVVDTGLEASAVHVALVRHHDGGAPRVAARRIDGRRWAFAMPSVTVSAVIDVQYADGGNSSSFVALRRIVGESEGLGWVDAYGDAVVWSERDAAAEGSGPDVVAPYFLMALVDGEVRRLAVAPRSVPFDVDVGPGEDGRAVAVYSRCEREASPADPGFVYSLPYPAYTRGDGCDIYRFDFATGRERKVAGPSTDQASEVLPSIWRDQIAFARVYEQREGSRGRYPYLYVRPLAGGHSQRQPGGSRGASGLPGPTSLDLYGRRLSFVWNYRTGPGSGDTGGVSEVRLDTLGGDHRVLSQARHDGTTAGGAYASFLSPQGSEGRIFYGYGRVRVEHMNKDSKPLSSLLLRYRLSDGDKGLARAPSEIAAVAITTRWGSSPPSGFPRPTEAGRFGRDGFYAQRRDFVEQLGGRTTIIDASDLVVR